MAVGVAVSWGQGVLTFQGEEHPFKIGGLSLVGIGGSSLKAEGQVFNLEVRHDDVYMTLSAKQEGAQIAAGGGALNIEFVDVAAKKE